MKVSPIPKYTSAMALEAKKRPVMLERHCFYKTLYLPVPQSIASHESTLKRVVVTILA